LDRWLSERALCTENIPPLTSSQLLPQHPSKSSTRD
jgi:hypothetical protein